MMTGVSLATLGAVKKPVVEIVPALADQVTAVLDVPLMRAVNCICSCDVTVALGGESDSKGDEFEEEGVVEVALCDAAPQPAIRPVRQNRNDRTRQCEIV